MPNPTMFKMSSSCTRLKQAFPCDSLASHIIVIGGIYKGIIPTPQKHAIIFCYIFILIANASYRHIDKKHLIFQHLFTLLFHF